MNLLIDLLVGTGKYRYLTTSSVRLRSKTSLQGHSAVCFLRLLWNLPHVSVVDSSWELTFGLPPASYTRSEAMSDKLHAVLYNPFYLINVQEATGTQLKAS